MIDLLLSTPNVRNEPPLEHVQRGHVEIDLPPLFRQMIPIKRDSTAAIISYERRVALLVDGLTYDLCAVGAGVDDLAQRALGKVKAGIAALDPEPPRDPQTPGQDEGTPGGGGDDAQRGLYRKYHVERLNDPDGKHRECSFFVLDLRHDPYARQALGAYIDACQFDYPKLANDLAALLSGDAIHARPAEVVEPVFVALPSAPLAPETHITPEAPNHPGAGEAGATESTQPADSDLLPLIRMVLDAWKELDQLTPYDAALAHLHRAVLRQVCSAVEPRCSVCGGAHRATQCPEVAQEWKRQEEQAAWGNAMFGLYRHHRDALVRSIQSAPMLSERAEALALYLGQQTGTMIDPMLVERHLGGLIENAAPA